ncbi:iron uptake porin [Lyngbya confervoides]|uniref:Iron uptake porin n=1 Tax=Lyngbya confervoides BDU141951 TaxID=1574623 RepID=A0ABD4T1H2_9CYAN|nr:iron uptake porin [Lyngbya confervoides]MCM1982290.1 iron uptake porin [Lyngbya confervoides BDU141951]
MNFLPLRVALGSTAVLASFIAHRAVAYEPLSPAPEQSPPEISAPLEANPSKRLDASVSAQFQGKGPQPRQATFPVDLAEGSDSLDMQPLRTSSQESYHLTPLLPSEQDHSAAQVTSVSQLSDVQPTDWAFQAVQSLVERYGCVAGYPDGTFRGNRAATRYELAALVNACLDNISDQFATKEDLEQLRALQEEFAAELATLRGRVDGLEARTATLEAQQFSTTTKLNGEAIMALSGFLESFNGQDERIRFTGRARLNFLTSFTGKDLLYTRFQASNQPINFSNTNAAPFTDTTGTAMTRLSWDTGNTNQEVILDRLSYKFPVGDKLTVTAFGNNAFHHYYATTTNPYYEGGGGGKGAVSFFAERNPIFRNGTVGVGNVTGIGTQYDISDDLRLDIGYLAGRTQFATATTLANGEDQNGLFGGTWGLLGQLSYKPFTGSQIALTYLRNHAPDGNIRSGVGSTFAQIPFVDGNGIAQAFSADSFGLEATFRVAKGFAIGGWAGYTRANQANSTNDAEILNAAINLTAFDIGKEGSQLGLIVGMPPKNINNDILIREDPDTSIHLEGLYQFPVNNNITITPGVIYVINPEHNEARRDIFVGVLRTTFSF